MRSPQPGMRSFRLKHVAFIIFGITVLLMLTSDRFLSTQHSQSRIERSDSGGGHQTQTQRPRVQPPSTWERATNCEKLPFQLTEGTEKILVRCTIQQGDVFKVKASKKVSSEKSRQGDFVSFETAQEVRSSVASVSDFQRGRVIIDKGKPAFGIVLERKHRSFPFIGGKLNVSLGAVMANDGTPIPVYIDRFRCPRCLSCLFKERRYCSEFCDLSARRSHKLNEICRPAAPPQYVSGRVDRNVAPVIGALASTALAFIKRDADDPFLRSYLLLTLLTQSGIPDLLAGTDAELQEGEIFDAYVTQTTQVVVEVTKPVFGAQ